MAALIGFRSPRGPRGRQPAGLEFASRGASRLRGVFSSFLSPPLLSLSVFNFFSSSPPPPLFPLPPDSRSSRVRSRRQSVQKGGIHTRRKASEWISFAYRRIAFLRPVSCPRVSSKQPCRGLFLLSASLLRRSFPFSLLSNDRPTDIASTRRPIVAAGLSFNLSIITLVSIRWIIRCYDEEEIVNEFDERMKGFVV